MKRELASLKTENEIFRKSGCGLNSSNDEKIAAVDKLKNEYSIHIICKTLGLLKSTYYHRVKEHLKRNGMKFVTKCFVLRFLRYLRKVKNGLVHRKYQ